MNHRRTAMRVLLFALLGLLFEVFFTSTGALIRGNWNWRGGTSPWMMIDYGILGLAVGPIASALKARRVPLALRAVVYMLGIFLVEYVSGEVFTALGLKIWDYSHLPLNLRGQITLTYAPAWYFLGLFLEYLHARIDACALVLSRGLTAEDLEQMPGR